MNPLQGIDKALVTAIRRHVILEAVDAIRGERLTEDTGDECDESYMYALADAERAVLSLSREDPREGKYYIMDTSYANSYGIQFWGPNRCGYTADLDAAGVYDEPEAFRISRTRAGTFAVPCEEIDAETETIRRLPHGAREPFVAKYGDHAKNRERVVPTDVEPV